MSRISNKITLHLQVRGGNFITKFDANNIVKDFSTCLSIQAQKEGGAVKESEFQVDIFIAS